MAKASHFRCGLVYPRTVWHGFERFNLQSVQSGHVKVTFLLEGHFLETQKTLPSRISGLPSVI